MKFALIGVSCAALLCGSSCASNSPNEPGAYLLRMVDYRTGARMELVNPAHTTAVEQYSKVRADPARKVTEEEWMSGLIQYMEDEGWSKEQREGSAPSTAGGLRWSLERSGPDGTSYVAAGNDAKGAELKRLLAIKNAFIATYSATPGFQAVRSEPGKLPFKVPEYPGATRKGGN